jgi:hypothetical protein
MDSESYSRLLGTVTVLEQAVIEIAQTLPTAARVLLSQRMGSLRHSDTDSPYTLSIQETADRIARGLSRPV